MNKIKAIHQFTPTVLPGDGVSSSVLYIQKILHDLGFVSNIYMRHKFTSVDLHHEVFYIGQYKEDEEQILLYHHSIGHNYHEQIMDFIDRKILIYHNITPSHFFKNEEHKQINCDLGRVQLKESSSLFIGSIAISKYNCKELLFYNYKNPIVLPILKDFNNQDIPISDKALVQKYSSTYNILFVGRVIQNKCQHQLLDVLFHLKQKGLSTIKLFIVGDLVEPKYIQYIREYSKNLNIDNQVVITGKVSSSELSSYYEASDLYLSLSEHEGFGMPLIEAMRFDIPVLAYNSGGISSTVIEESLFEFKSSSSVVKKIISLQNNPQLRVEMIKKQKKHLNSFSYNNIKKNFLIFLNSLDIHAPFEKKTLEYKEVKSIGENYQIEGPFDSTYSLALVNKNIAKSLNKCDKTNVKLYSTEGHGDFEPKQELLDESTKNMFFSKLTNIDVTIRNLYPPRTNSMKGYHKIIGPYGWEESKFPQEYVLGFNSKLTQVFTMSNYVKNILKDNGVRTPIETTGIVADDILDVKSESFSFDLPNNFKLLHISSAFPRKGINILLESFDSLNHKFDISLILKTFPNVHNNVIELINKHEYTIKKTYEDGVFLYTKSCKKILLINKDIEEGQIKYLYENSNVLIAPSFGEGFGLPMAEAMLCNLPVVTTGYGGQTDFCTNETSWLIDFDFAYAKTHMNLFNSVWAVPKVSSLNKSIEEIYNLSNNEIKNKTDLAKQFILDNYTKEKISKNIKNVLEKYPMKIKKKNIGLFSTFNSKCGIAEYSKYLISSFEDNIKIFAPVIPESEKIETDTFNIKRTWDYGRETKDINLLKKELLNNNIKRLILQYNFGFLSLDTLKDLIDFCINNGILIYLFLHSTMDIIRENETISLNSIKKQLLKVKTIYVHSVADLNYLKEFGIYLNTYLFTHAIDSKLLVKESKVNNTIPVLATFGFLLPQKGISRLVDVLHNLHQKGIKAKLLLLTSLYPIGVSKQLEIEIKNKIKKLNLEKFITFDTRYLDESNIVKKLTNVDKLLFLYDNTQESSSAAVRIGLLSQKEVITTPVSIFDDVKDMLTQTRDYSIQSITDTVVNSLEKNYDNKKQKEWINQNSWEKVSKTFYNSLL